MGQFRDCDYIQSRKSVMCQGYYVFQATPLTISYENHEIPERLRREWRPKTATR